MGLTGHCRLACPTSALDKSGLVGGCRDTYSAVAGTCLAAVVGIPPLLSLVRVVTAAVDVSPLLLLEVV